MAKITIVVRGISLIYHKNDGLWRVLFPFDDCHTIKFKTPQNGAGVSLTIPGLKVRAKANGPTSVFKVGDRFEDFLDLTGEGVHENGLKPKGGADRPAVLLTMQNAEFSLGEPTNSDFQFIDAGVPIGPFRQVAYSGKAVIECKELVIEADGVTGFPQTFDQDGTQLVFDNICFPDPDPFESDLKLLYTIIEDAGGTGKEFTVDRPDDQKPSPFESPHTEADDFTGFGQEDNNVRPLIDEGLPCNVFKASEATLLD